MSRKWRLTQNAFVLCFTLENYSRVKHSTRDLYTNCNWYSHSNKNPFGRARSLSKMRREKLRAYPDIRAIFLIAVYQSFPAITDGFLLEWLYLQRNKKKRKKRNKWSQINSKPARFARSTPPARFRHPQRPQTLTPQRLPPIVQALTLIAPARKRLLDLRVVVGRPPRAGAIRVSTRFKI